MNEKIRINKEDLKIRKTWKIDPETKVEKVKNQYKRSNTRREIEEALEEMQHDMDFEI